MKPQITTALNSNRFITALLSALIFLCIAVSVSQGSSATFNDPQNDTTSVNINDKESSCGDVVETAFRWATPFLDIGIRFKEPPLSSGAKSLILKLTVTSFAKGAPEQTDITLKADSKGPMKASNLNEAGIRSAELRGDTVQIRFKMPKGCRRVGLSTESRLNYANGFCTDEVDYHSFRLAESQPSLKPTPSKAPLSRERYVPSRGRYGWKDSPEKAVTLFKEAKKLASTEPAKAWDTAESAFKLTPDYRFKRTILTFLLNLKATNAPPPSPKEQRQLEVNKGNEHIRVLNDVSVPSWPGRILKAQFIKQLQKEYGLPDREVKVSTLRSSYLNTLKTKYISEYEEIKRKKPMWKFLKLAASELSKRNFELAYRLCYEYLTYLSTGIVEGQRPRAEELLLKTGAAACENVPKDERKALNEIMKHKAFTNMGTRVSKRFIFLGPSNFLKSIPHKSIRNLEVAYVIESDFFNTSAKTMSKRIVVFIRELYGVMGGMGGGNQIFISFKYAKKHPSAKYIDNKLYFHELAHCLVDYNFPVAGLNEGIADLGAQIALEMLNKPDAHRRRTEASAMFRHYFTQRGIPFERIPSYAPSHGFLIYPLTKIPMIDGILNWAPLRAFFRDLKSYPLSRPNILQWQRHYVKALEPYFGKRVFEIYEEAGCDFASDLYLTLQDELNCYSSEYDYASFVGWKALEALADRIAKENPDSYFRHVVRLQALSEAVKVNDTDATAKLRRSCGIPERLLAAGPFLIPDKALKVDYGQGDHHLTNVEIWTSSEAPENRLGAKELRAITCEPDGWFTLPGGAGVQGIAGSELIGYTRKLIAPAEGYIWVTSDTGFALWIDDCIVRRVDNRCRASGVADALRIPFSLSSGYHRIALRLSGRAMEFKVRVRFTDMQGAPSTILPLSAGSPSNYMAKRPPDVESAELLFEDEFSTKRSFSHWNDQAVEFKLKGGFLIPIVAGAEFSCFIPRRVENQLSDIGLFWLRKTFKDDRLYYNLHFEPQASGKGGIRGAIIFDGEGRHEINSGIAVHFIRIGNTTSISVLHYSSELYSSYLDTGKGSLDFDLYRYGRWLWVELNGQRVLPPLKLPSIRKGKFGFALTPALGLDCIEIRRLQTK